MLCPYHKSTWTVILFLLAGWPAFSILVSSTSEMPDSVNSLSLEVYLPTLLIQILLILLIFWTLSRSKENLSSVGLVGITLENFVWGIVLLVIASLFFSVLSQIFHSLDQPEEIQQFLPRTGLDYVIWIILSLAAAVGEEFSFRGFLITRLTPLLGNFGAAALLSSLSFGLGHLYQGLVGVIFTAIYGLLLAALFYWRKSIFPCIVTHFLQDALAPWMYDLTQGPTN